PGAAPLPLSDYTGLYKDDFYGSAQVSREGGHLVLKLDNPDFLGDLEHWHGNTFRVTWRYAFYGKDYLTFDLDPYGKPEKIRFAGMALKFEKAEEAAK
ncbi:MAG TPA: DUF3471 domain-containing protein, partial [Nitrospira sp.]|nr:DUF3471 domain-containing protein [Nitrospira sp.]